MGGDDIGTERRRTSTSAAAKLTSSEGGSQMHDRQAIVIGIGRTEGCVELDGAVNGFCSG
jgi:hypothetical protein